MPPFQSFSIALARFSHGLISTQLLDHNKQVGMMMVVRGMMRMLHADNDYDVNNDDVDFIMMMRVSIS